MYVCDRLNWELCYAETGALEDVLWRRQEQQQASTGQWWGQRQHSVPRTSRDGRLSCGTLRSVAAALLSSLNCSRHLNLAVAAGQPAHLPGLALQPSRWLCKLPTIPRMLKGARVGFCCLQLAHLTCVNSWFTNSGITVPFLLSHNSI